MWTNRLMDGQKLGRFDDKLKKRSITGNLHSTI